MRHLLALQCGFGLGRLSRGFGPLPSLPLDQQDSDQRALQGEAKEGRDDKTAMLLPDRGLPKRNEDIGRKPPGRKTPSLELPSINLIADAPATTTTSRALG